jgi:hypothetical protein
MFSFLKHQAIFNLFNISVIKPLSKFFGDAFGQRQAAKMTFWRSQKCAVRRPSTDLAQPNRSAAFKPKLSDGRFKSSFLCHLPMILNNSSLSRFSNSPNFHISQFHHL